MLTGDKIHCCLFTVKINDVVRHCLLSAVSISMIHFNVPEMHPFP